MTVMSLPRSSWALPRMARALRPEFKRNAVPYLLPLLAAVFYFGTIRTADGFPPVWTLRSSVIGDNMLIEFSVFAGGLAAWAGSREGRRKTRDLVGTTPRAAWARLSVALAGTLGWLLLAFLAGVAVLYIQTALQATWGGPPLWPVFVGAAGVTAVTVIGFTAGALFPGRFTGPLAALGVAVLDLIGFREALSVTASSGTYALLSPNNTPPLVDTGVYYHVAPDLSIVQVMFMGGIAVALFGVLGLAPGLRQLARPGGRPSLRAALTRGDGWLPRAVAVLLVACGVAASGTGLALAGTAKPDAAGGWEIPALHSAASDQPVPAVPLNAAQQAVEDALMTVAGSPPHHIFIEMGGKPGAGTVAALSAAAQRFARLPAGARHAWLAVHLAALRAGTITVAQIP